MSSRALQPDLFAREPASDWRPPSDPPRLDGCRAVAIDVETRDPDLKTKGPSTFRGGSLVGIAVGTDDGRRFYLPMRHEGGDNLDPEEVLRWARRELGASRAVKVGHKLVYDLEWLASEGVDVPGPHHDTMVADHLLDENARSFSLEAVGRRRVARGKVEADLTEAAKALGLTDPKGEMWRLPARHVGPYAEGDVDLPLAIREAQAPLLEPFREVLDVEMRVLPCLVAMRLRGVRVDVPAAENARVEISSRLGELEAELRDLTGLRIRPWSSEDLRKACDRLGIRYLRTASGRPSFVKDWLKGQDHPMFRAVVEWRELDKLKGTFVEGSVLDHAVEGRVRSQFNQIGARTGRFSSSNPDLQFIPSRDERWAPRVRGLFVAETGEVWERLDYSQLEFRLLAHYAMGRGAEDVRERYRTEPDVDFHRAVADMAGIDRKKAKTINFGLVYGMMIPKLARSLGLEIDEAEDLFGRYHEEVPFVKRTYEIASRRAGSRGYVHTLLGRRRRYDLWEPRGPGGGGHPLPREEAEATWGSNLRRAFAHTALNSILQGGAADVVKVAMAETWESGVCDVLGAPLLQVHDELDFSRPATRAGEEAIQEARRICAGVLADRLLVPLVVDRTSGGNWGECG